MMYSRAHWERDFVPLIRTLHDVIGIAAFHDVVSKVRREAVVSRLWSARYLKPYSLYRMHSVQVRHLTRCNIRLSACKLYLSQVTKAIESKVIVQLCNWQFTSRCLSQIMSILGNDFS